MHPLTTLHPARRRSRALFFLAAVVSIFFAAALYFQVLAAQDSGPGRDAWQRPEDVMSALALVPGSRVADVGAGNGYFVRHLSRRVGPDGRVFAVDIDSDSLDRLRRTLKDENLTNVEVIHGETNDPRLPPASLDAILVVNAYHEMREADAMLRAFHSALKPGGLLAIIDAVGGDDRSRESAYSSHTIAPSVVRAEASRNSFRFLRDEPGFKRPDGRRHSWFFLVFQKPSPSPE